MSKITFTPAQCASLGNVANMRLDSTTRALLPVGAPTLIASGDWKPLARFPDRDTAILVDSLHNLRLITAGNAVTIGPLPAAPVGIIPQPTGYIIMLPSGPVSLLPIGNAGWILADPATHNPPLALVAVDRPLTSVTIPACELSRVYSSRHFSLGDTDASRVSAALCGSYRELAAACLESDTYLQPMLGYYTLRGADGSLLYRSAPVILGPSCGLNLFGIIPVPLGYSAAAGGYNTTVPTSLDANPYQVALKLCADPATAASCPILSRAATVEVFLSPQIHLLDPSLPLEHRVDTFSDNTAQLTLYLPGVASGMSPRLNVAPRYVKAMMASLDRALAPAMRLSFDLSAFRSIGSAIECPPVPVTVDNDIALLKSFQRRSVAALSSSTAPLSVADTLAEATRYPHSFSAGAVTSAGSRVLWGDITPRLFEGYNATALARDFTTSVGQSLVSVDVYCSSSGISPRAASVGTLAPATLSPLLCYPFTQAREMKIAVEYPDGPHGLSFELTTIPGSPYAFYLDPALRPISLTVAPRVGRFVAADVAPFIDPVPGGILSADIAAPLSPLHSSLATVGSVDWLSLALRPSSGWNFAHARFYLFASDGIFALSVDSVGRVGAPLLISPLRASAPPVILDNSMLVVASGNLLRVKGMAVETLRHDVKAVGYNPPFDEVWLLPAAVDGKVKVYRPDFSTFYIRPDLSPRSLFSFPSGMLLLDDEGNLLDCAAESVAGSVPVACDCRFHLPPGLKINNLLVEMAASAASGTISFLGDSGLPDRAATILSSSVDGILPGPLFYKIASAAPPYLTLRLSLNASTDLRFTSLILN